MLFTLTVYTSILCTKENACIKSKRQLSFNSGFRYSGYSTFLVGCTPKTRKILHAHGWCTQVWVYFSIFSQKLSESTTEKNGGTLLRAHGTPVEKHWLKRKERRFFSIIYVFHLINLLVKKKFLSSKFKWRDGGGNLKSHTIKVFKERERKKSSQNISNI